MWRAWCAGLAMCAALAWSAPGSASGRHLPPSIGPRLEQALDAADGPTRLPDAAIERDRVAGEVCLRAAGGACARFALSDPLPSCAARVVGPWCLAWPDGVEPGLEAAVAERLTRAFSDATWNEAPDAPRRPARPGEAKAPSAGSADATGDLADADDDGPIEAQTKPLLGRGSALVALLVLLGALTLGWLVGWGQARILARWVRPAWVSGVVALALLIEVLHLNVAWTVVGLWDAAGVGLLALGGVLLGGAHATGRLQWRGLAVSALAALLGLGLAEAGARLAGITPDVDRQDVRGLWLDPALRDHADTRYGEETDHWHRRACRLLFSGGSAEPGDAGAPGDGTRVTTVAHLGDSMTWGLGVAVRSRFTSLLNREGGVRHVNLASPATGPDYHVAVAQRRLAEFRPELVVLHLFAGNDLEEIDAPYGCCHGGPLFTEEPVPKLRCTAASWRSTDRGRVVWLATRSPAPWPLRASASWLALGAAGERAFLRLSSRIGGGVEGRWRQNTDGERLWRRMDALMGRLAQITDAGGLAVLLVVHPARTDLLAPASEREQRREFARRVMAMAEQRGWGSFDLQPTLEAMLREAGPERWFLDQAPDDPHYTQAAHARVAVALGQRISVALAGRRTSALH